MAGTFLVVIGILVPAPAFTPAHACTVFKADGSVTEDGRPMMAKIRDTDEGRQLLVHSAGSPYDYIGIKTEGGSVLMGLNEMGVASGNALINPSDLPNANSGIQTYILRNKASIGEIYTYIQSQTEPYSAMGRGAFPFIDGTGHAALFELSGGEWWIYYDTMNLSRATQGLLGVVVRANEFHQHVDGTDDTSITGGRYESGSHNVLGLIQAGVLSARTTAQGAGAFEYFRYGPGRPLATLSRSTTRSAIVAHGVAPGEDPSLATLWVILGQTNYGIAVPAWVAVGAIPACLANGDMYDRARSLYLKGNEATIQAGTLPAEARLFDAVDNVLLPHWRTHETPSVAVMTRVEHRMASDAYSLMDCLDNLRNNNKAPDASFEHENRGLTVDFTSLAQDADGSIQTHLWDFGDGETSPTASPSHGYNASGAYLVSCTVTDNEGVSSTDWRYLEVSVIRPDLDADGDVDLADFNVFSACFNGPNRTPVYPGSCDIADLDGDGDVDLTDFSVFSACFNGPNRSPACAP